MSTESRVVAHTQRWLDDVVIALNLCPFARKERASQRIVCVVSGATDEEALLVDLATQCQRLVDDDTVETTLLIHPHVLTQFDAYNQFLNRADDCLERLALTGVLQVASFHPAYQFAGTAGDDAENFTNRSPYPMLHLLREDSVERAIEAHPDAARIPHDNIRALNQLGADHLRALLDAIVRD